MNNIDIEQQSTRQIKFGAVVSYAAVAFNIASGLLYTPWMLEQIGKSNFALYTLAISLISMFTIDFGMSAAVTRFISKYNAESNQEKVNSFLGVVYKLYFIITGIICVALVITFFFLDVIYTKLTPSEIDSFKIVYVIASFTCVVSFPFITANGILASYEKFIQIKSIDIFNKLITVLVTVLALSLGMGLYALVFINSVCNLLAILVKLYVIKKKTSVKVNFAYKDRSLLKEIFGFSLWTTITSIMQRLFFNITPTILGIVSNTVFITFFSLAATLEGYVYLFAQAINGMFLPKISRILSKSEDGSNSTNLMIKVGRINLSIVALIIIGFIIFGNEFLATVWLRKSDINHKQIYICAILLMLPSLVHLPQEIAHTTMIAMNKVRLNAIIFTICGFLNVILSLCLSYYYGALGASIAICISYLFRTFLLNIAYHSVLKIKVVLFFKECYLRLLPAFLLSMGIGLIISKWISITTGIVNFVMKTMLFFFVYFLIMWILGWNKYEKNLFKSLTTGLVTKIRKKTAQ